MLITVALLQRRGISTTGNVGSDKPLESMTDALGAFPATHVLLATPPEEESYWLERDLLAKARALTKLPVTQATVASGQPPGSTDRQRQPNDRLGRTAEARTGRRESHDHDGDLV
jgi:hypothetical protein